MDRSTKMAHDRHKPYSNPQTQQLGEDMQVGDLVKMVGFIGTGVLTLIGDGSSRGHHTHRVLFAGTGYEKLDGYHWCDPSTLEVIS